MIGEIPQSTVLSEAGEDSLTEVMSRDPEHLSRQDRDRIIEALRAQRARLALAEAAAPRRAPAGTKAPLLAKSAKDLGDMGL